MAVNVFIIQFYKTAVYFLNYTNIGSPNSLYIFRHQNVEGCRG